MNWTPNDPTNRVMRPLSVFAAALLLGLGSPASAQDSGSGGAKNETLFGPGRDKRLPMLDSSVSVLGEAPTPSIETLSKYDRLVQQTIDPDNTLDLVIGRARVLVLKRTPTRVQGPSELLLDTRLLSDRELSLTGSEVGAGVLNIYFNDDKDPATQDVLSYLVRVMPDPEERARLERNYKALENQINLAFPDSSIELQLVGDKLIVRGQARDVQEASQIIRLVVASAPDPTLGKIPTPGLMPAADPNNPDALSTPGQLNYGVLGASGSHIVNLIRVPGEAQVMLKVTVAEVNRAAARSIGINFAWQDNEGDFNIFNPTNPVRAGLGISPFITYASRGEYPYNVAVRALRTLSLARSMAEPNLVTMNGQTATFRAGGQFPVPVVTGATATGLQGVEFRDTGVSLEFTPYVTDKDRIRLAVKAEVSARSTEQGANVGGDSVSGIDSRRFDTTVELREGETIAVAGLVQQTFGSLAVRVPLLGDLPFIGLLFSQNATSMNEQELVILVTPELVRPMKAGEVPPLPGADMFEPDDWEFYVRNRIESKTSEDYRSTIRTNWDRIARYRRVEKIYIAGPSGQTYDSMRR